MDATDRLRAVFLLSERKITMADKVATDTTLSPQVEVGLKELQDGTFVKLVGSLSTVTDSLGHELTPDSLSHTYAYNGSNQIVTDTATDGNGNTWVQTFTYTGSLLTGQSQWVKQ